MKPDIKSEQFASGFGYVLANCLPTTRTIYYDNDNGNMTRFTIAIPHHVFFMSIYRLDKGFNGVYPYMTRVHLFFRQPDMTECFACLPNISASGRMCMTNNEDEYRFTYSLAPYEELPSQISHFWQSTFNCDYSGSLNYYAIKWYGNENEKTSDILKKIAKKSHAPKFWENNLIENKGAIEHLKTGLQSGT